MLRCPDVCERDEMTRVWSFEIKYLTRWSMRKSYKVQGFVVFRKLVTPGTKRTAVTCSFLRLGTYEHKHRHEGFFRNTLQNAICCTDSIKKLEGPCLETCFFAYFKIRLGNILINIEFIKTSAKSEIKEKGARLEYQNKNWCCPHFLRKLISKYADIPWSLRLPEVTIELLLLTETLF